MNSELFDYYRATFLRCDLLYGRHFGSKSAYSQRHPEGFYVPNGCIYTRNQTCVWRGDLDLATADDIRGLVRASRLLRRKLFIMREQFISDARMLPRSWVANNAIITIWRGKITVAGHYRSDPRRALAALARAGFASVTVLK
jgi:hypothetical protein